jgi:hypothetical protein
MPFGDIPLGGDALITVGATSTPATQVGGINSYNLTQDRATTTRKYFMEAARVFVGESVDTWELGGDYSVGDSGQDFIRAAYIAGTAFFIQVLVDGTEGFKQNVISSHAELRGPSPDDPPATTFQFGGQAAMIPVP